MEPGKVMLFSQKIISLKPFDVSDSNYWPDSNIRQWLNSDKESIAWKGKRPNGDYIFNRANEYDNEKGFLADGNFTAGDRNAILGASRKVTVPKSQSGKANGGDDVVVKKALVEGESTVPVQDNLYYQNIADKVFFLTLNDIRDLLSDRDQSQIDIYGYLTKEAMAKHIANRQMGLDIVWDYWLMSPDFESPNSVYTVNEHSPTISAEGTLKGSIAAAPAITDTVGVRPAIYVKPGAISLESGTGLLASPYRAIGVAEKAVRFSDVSQSAWYYGAVQEALASSLMKGKENNRFDPDGNLTVAELLAINLNLMSAWVSTSVSSGNWYDPVVDEALKRGLIRRDDSFYGKLNEAVTRSEMAAVIVRTVDILSKGAIVGDYAWVADVFGDVQTIPENLRESVYKAYASGILKGKDGGNYAGGQFFTRAEAATLACRVKNLDFQLPSKP
ncbi:MAG: S-layer homology domain-containing protein [Clostridiales bacterium]|nr:S-layer homology domain-containing protein [Clostridiales bacterium]